MHKQIRAAVIGALVAGSLGGTTYAVAAGEGRSILGGQRNPASTSKTLTRETQVVADNSTYSTRQSNKSNNGGGAVYGCRSAEGGTPRDNEPCVRANNLSRGLSFEFETDGDQAGTFATRGGDATRPFTTNATGVATGLNADRVDSLGADQLVALARMKDGLDADTVDGASAAQLRTRWLLVNAQGEIERQSGGFAIAAAYPATPAAANGNVYISAGEDLSDNGLTATIALQNQVNQGGGTMNGTNSGGDGSAPAAGDNLEFSGEISATQCGLAGIVACAPAGTNNASHFVVSPRLSDGQRTTADTRKRFYVVVTE